jgi:hypothetical protein
MSRYLPKTLIGSVFAERVVLQVQVRANGKTGAGFLADLPDSAIEVKSPTDDRHRANRFLARTLLDERRRTTSSAVRRRYRKMVPKVCDDGKSGGQPDCMQTPGHAFHVIPRNLLLLCSSYPILLVTTLAEYANNDEFRDFSGLPPHHT